MTLTPSQLVGDNYSNSFNSSMKYSTVLFQQKKGGRECRLPKDEAFIIIMINHKSTLSLNLGKRLFETFNEVVGHVFGETQGWEQAENVCRGTAGEAVLGVNKILTQRLVRHVEVDAYHEAAATYVGDVLLRSL